MWSTADSINSSQYGGFTSKDPDTAFNWRKGLEFKFHIGKDSKYYILFTLCCQNMNRSQQMPNSIVWSNSLTVMQNIQTLPQTSAVDIRIP